MEFREGHNIVIKNSYAEYYEESIYIKKNIISEGNCVDLYDFEKSIQRQFFVSCNIMSSSKPYNFYKEHFSFLR